MKDRKDADLNRTYGDSPEYGDLRLFLDVCREQKYGSHADNAACKRMVVRLYGIS